MSNPMLSEKWESSSKSSRRELKRRERKTWKKPIRVSRLPSFTGSDQIPVIFSGYTAESEDSSSSSEMSDDSITYSTKSPDDDEKEEVEIDQVQESSGPVSRVSSMKVLRRQSTRKLSLGGGHKLMKMRSMKSSRYVLRKKNLDLISREEDLGGLLLEPRYLRPTSSSASKNVENVQKNLQAARLKRMTSLRYKGLLKATCSSAMKGSSPSAKKSDDGCKYRYCSLHGQPHSHGVDDDSSVVHVPSLKRFASMRKRFLKRQKSVNRRLVLLKRTLSRREPSGGQVVTDQGDDDNVDGETNQEVFEEEVSSWEICESDSEMNRGSTESVMVDGDDNGDGGMDSVETVASPGIECVQESQPEIMDDSYGKTEKDMEEIVTDLDHDDDVKVKSEETMGDNEEVCSELREENVKKTGNMCYDEESKPENVDDSDGRIDKDSKESNMTGLDYYNEKIEGSKSEETVEDDEDEKNTEDVWNDTVTLVKQAFDEILAEITDDGSSDDSSVTKNDTLEGELAKEYDDDSSDSSGSDAKPIEGRDTHLSVIVSTSHIREESGPKRGAKNWSYLKRVILLKRFLKSLDRKERRKRSDAEENETIMRLRRELVGERKNAEEWMLDHALRQVITTLAPPQKRKVKHLIKAFESLILIPVDGSSRGHGGLGSPGREEKQTMNLQTILREGNDTTDLPEVLSGKDLEETKLTREASSSLSLGMKSDEGLESIEDSSSSHHPAVEEVLYVLASGSSIEEKEEKTRDSSIEEKIGESEKKNIFTWRNLIQKNMVLEDNNERKLDESEQDYRWSYGTNQMTGTEDHGDAAATIKSFQEAFEMILSEIPDDEEIVSESSNSLKEEKEDHGETKKSWNSLRKVILLKRFVKSLEKVHVFNPRKLRNLPVASEPEEAENVLLRHRSTMEQIRTDGEEWMLDYAMRQAISRLAPIERKKVELLVQAFDTVLDGHETVKQTKRSNTPRNNDETVKEGTPTVEEDSEVNKDEQRIKSVFSKFQVHQKNLKQEEEVDTPLSNVEAVTEGTLREEKDYEVNKDEQRITNVFSRFQVHQKDLKQEEDTPRNNVEAVTEVTLRAKKDSEVNKDEQTIANVFSRFQVHQKDLKREEEVDSTSRKSRNLLPPIGNVKQKIVVEKEKDSRMWKLIYKHMVTEKEEETSSANGESVASVEDEAVDVQIDARRSGTVALVREALEKILSEIPDNSSDDQSLDSATDQELWERSSQVSDESTNSKPKSNEKRVKGWNNVKKVILLKRFVSDLGRLNPKTPRGLPWEPDPETEKIRLRHQEVGGKRNSEEWMLDYALRQAISTLAPSQRRKVSLLAQAFDTISLQDVGRSSTTSSAATSRNISRQSSLSSMTVHSENEGNAEILRGKLRKLQEDLKETTKVDGVATDLEEKQQCSSLWRLLCKQMEDNERNQTLPQEPESEEDTNMDGEKIEVYKTEAVELLGEVIDGISLEESQDQTRQKSGTLQASQVRINRWSSLKKAMQLRKFVKALENVRKFNPREPRFLPLEPGTEAERVNLRHQETQNKRKGDEWMVDNELQEVVSKLTPARRDKVKLLVQAFESLSATGN